MSVVSTCCKQLELDLFELLEFSVNILVEMPLEIRLLFSLDIFVSRNWLE